MAVSKLNPSAAGIPFGDNAGRPSNATTGQPYFNGEEGRLELYTGTGWNNIVQETPGISSAIGHYYESDGYGTFTISGTNFVDGAIAYAIGTNNTEYQATTTTYNSLVQLSVTFTGLSAAYEPYDIKVVNPSNLFGLLPDAFYINQSPIWSTSSGSLGTVYANSSVSKSVAGTDPESGTLTYASSDLPSWLSLNTSTGALTGTTPTLSSDTTYTFNITVSDASNAAVSRQFNIPVTAIPVISGGTLTSDSTYYYRTFTSNGNLVVSGKAGTVDIFTIAGGGGGGEGGGGAGAIVYHSAKTLSTATYAVAIGAGGSAGTGNSSGTSGASSQFASYHSANGGGFGGGAAAGAAGGCGGGGRRDGGNSGGSSNQTLSTATAIYGYAGGTSPATGWVGAAGGGGTGEAGGAGSGNGTQAYERSGKGGAGTTAFSSWLSGISSGMTAISGWSTATSGGNIGGGGTGGQEGTTFGADSVYTGGAGGGGGAKRYTDTTFLSSGVTNTGSGGGGVNAAFNQTAGAGGSGLAIVRYTRASVGG
jgi:hypothetical protein